jgi:hypothetical protein
MRPIEWAHGQSLRLLEWFNQERWTLALTVLALVTANLVVLYFLLQGQDVRALAFVVIILLAAISWLVPEFSVAVLIVAGSGLYVNLLYYATGTGATGMRSLLLVFLRLCRPARFMNTCAPRPPSVPEYSHGSRFCSHVLGLLYGACAIY